MFGLEIWPLASSVHACLNCNLSLYYIEFWFYLNARAVYVSTRPVDFDKEKSKSPPSKLQKFSTFYTSVHIEKYLFTPLQKYLLVQLQMSYSITRRLLTVKVRVVRARENSRT